MPENEDLWERYRSQSTHSGIAMHSETSRSAGGNAGAEEGGLMRSEAFGSHRPDPREIWARSRDRLSRTLLSLGFEEELGQVIAKHLGSPQAIDRMNAYLLNVKPKKMELVVDEMLSIRSEIDAWKEKKKAEEANAAYNEILLYGFSGGDVDEDEEAPVQG